jgi:hypothetical protein
MAGGNAGLIKPSVWILNGSPFNSFRKQEQCFYITTETFNSAQEVTHVVPLPSPVNGCRIEEQRSAYDNYIIDERDDRLEKSTFIEKVTTSDGQSVDINTEFDATASARYRLKQFSDSESKSDEAQRKFFTWQCQTSIFGDESRKFTETPEFDSFAEWTYINIPKPSLVTSLTTAANASMEIAAAMAGPGVSAQKLTPAAAAAMASKIGQSGRILMPYQRKIPKDKSTPVHWGLKMKDRPWNQPFELTHYICFRDASVADLAPEQRTTTGQGSGNKFSFHYPNQNGGPGKPMDIKLNKSLYLAIEMGEESDTNHFLLLFNYGHAPQLFWITSGQSTSNSGSTDTKNSQDPCLLKPSITAKAATKQEQATTQDGKLKAVLVNSYTNDTIVDTMFNSKLFTISIESAGGCLFVRCSAFPNAPWIIHPNMINKNSGLFIGETISVYGGNIQAGIAYSPIQYFKEGTLTMAGVTFEIPPEGVSPTLSVSSLGPSQVLQEQSKSSSGSSERLMVDTEQLVIEYGTDEADRLETYGYVNTLLGNELPFGQAAGETPINRLISMNLLIHRATLDAESETRKKGLLSSSGSSASCTKLQESMDMSISSAFGAPLGLLAFRTGSVTPVTWYPQVYLTSSDVKTKTGFVISNGRSPYLWLYRLFVIPPEKSTAPSKKYDLSCDVMSIDLSWNSTGPGEVSCSGSMKVLASPRAGTGDNSVTDLMSLTRRISYIQIEVERESSVISDKLEKNDRRIFTGCIVGAEVQDEPGKTVITFKLEDYMWVLGAMKFNLSPYYDGMAYNYALADILAQTGFPYDRMYHDQVNLVPFGGKPGPDPDKMPALPCTNMFEQPQFRFKDGEALKDGMNRIAKLDWKMMYFDPKGDFHYDSIPWGMYGDQGGATSFDFVTGDSLNWTPDNLVWNNVSRGYAMRDMYNSIQIITVSKAIPSLYLLFQDINRDSIEKPDSDGYIGFPKVMRQKEAMFERADVAFAYFKSLRDILYLPPRTIKFETYGRIGLRPAAVVSVDGLPWRMMNINLKLDASKNEFWASVEGEWFDHKGKAQTGDPVKNPGQPTQSQIIPGGIDTDGAPPSTAGGGAQYA